MGRSVGPYSISNISSSQSVRCQVLLKKKHVTWSYLKEEALISVQARCLQFLGSNLARQTSYACMSSCTTVVWYICLSTDLFSHIIILGSAFLCGVMKPPNISFSQGLHTKKSAGRAQPRSVMPSKTF
jgi:hypothetical protein